MANFTLKYGYSTITDGNMDFRFGVQKEVLENRRRFFLREDVDIEKVSVMKIDFDNEFVWVGEKEVGRGVKSYEDAIRSDILLTDRQESTLAVLTADCAPVILFDSKLGLMSLIHVGSKNLALGTLSVAVEELRNVAGAEQLGLVAFVGPCIEEDHYCFNTIPDDLKNIEDSFEKISGKFCLDLKKEVKKQLLGNGVEKVTFDNSSSYEGNIFSHRRAVAKGEKEGRFITYAETSKK